MVCFMKYSFNMALETKKTLEYLLLIYFKISKNIYIFKKETKTALNLRVIGSVTLYLPIKIQKVTHFLGIFHGRIRIKVFKQDFLSFKYYLLKM